MRSKKKGIIFSVILIVLMATGVYFMYIKKDAPQTDSEDNMTLSEEELESLDDTAQEEQELLLAERESYFNECMEVYDKPDYHEGKYGPTYNQEFVKGQCKFRDIYGMVEYEFIGYEELDDLCDYAEEIDWEQEDLWKTGWDGSTKGLYIETGLMNRDGTFNPQTRKVGRWNEDYTGVEEEKVYENSELVAVKVTVRYKNLSAKENDVYYTRLHTMWCNICMDDGELYAMSSIYRRNMFFETYTPIYTSMSQRYPLTNDIIGSGVVPICITLQPYEEYTGELIYVVFKDELENMCFFSNLGANGDNLNYKDLGTNIVMFSYLKEALGGNK